MKNWNTPEIKELSVSGTEFGQTTTRYPDYTFKDQDGHIFHSYSGTGEDTDNRKDIVDPINP